MSVQEIAEKIESAAHPEEHGGDSSSRHIGVTMALLGVLVALVSALGNNEQTDLLTATIGQSMRSSAYQAEASKFRTMDANFDLLSSLTPKPAELEHINTTLRAKRTAGGEADSEDTAELKELVASATEDIVEVLSPDQSVVDEFKGIATRYRKDMQVAKAAADAYGPLIAAHQDAENNYDLAQLGAEVGIVIASVALLLSSRKLWLASVGLGALSTAGVLYTFVSAYLLVQSSSVQIEKANQALQQAEAQAEMDQVRDERKDATPATH